MLIDTHAHLNFKEFESDLPQVLKRANNVGIKKIVMPSSEEESAKRALKIVQNNPQVFAAIGVHPLYLVGAGSLFVEDGSPQGFYTKDHSGIEDVFYLKDFEEMLVNPQVVAIGEIGLDYFSSPHRENPINRSLQLEVLEKMLQLAVEYKKPAILHIRTSKNSDDAFWDLINLVDRLDKKPKMVVHCFSGDLKISKELLARGFMISFTNLTFYMEKTKKAFSKIPLDKVMLETDSPFLCPFGNKPRNEPSYLLDIATKLADLRDISLKKFSKITTTNAQEFFGI